MSNSILMSIKPEFCNLIAAGEKTIEIRKTLPAKIKPPYKVYFYCTQGGIFYRTPKNAFRWMLSNSKRLRKKLINKDNTILNGKVIGEFICDKEYPVAYYLYDGRLVYNESILKETCLTKTEIANYANGKDVDGLHISDLVVYDEPKELEDFAKANFPTFNEKTDTASLCKFCPASNFGEDFANGVSDDFHCDTDCYDAYEEYAAQNRFFTRPPQSWCYVEERI